MSEIWFKRPTIESIATTHIDTAVEHLEIEFTEIGDDHLVAKMPTTPRTRQPYGTIHGGVSLVLAETIGSCGAAACVDAERFRVFGQEINGNHLRPNYEGWVYGTGRPVMLGRRSQVWSIEIRNEAGKMTCISRLTMAVVERTD
ncbi:MAG: hotdog fold thioesterase [Pseudomonadota bacterium]